MQVCAYGSQRRKEIHKDSSPNTHRSKECRRTRSLIIPSVNRTISLTQIRDALAGQTPRTRFAPSVTGHLHLGHAVNAVYVWGLARALGGEVIIRLEDHDRGRYRPEF